MNFVEHRDAKARRESAIRVAKAILNLDLYPPQKRWFLSECIWKITEANGKYTTRFCSTCAALKLESDRSVLSHDHVYRRKLLIDALLASPKDVDSILARAIGCTVTRDEHKKLSELNRAYPNIDGWQRYLEVGIDVVDMSTGELYPLAKHGAIER